MRPGDVITGVALSDKPQRAESVAMIREVEGLEAAMVDVRGGEELRLVVSREQKSVTQVLQTAPRGAHIEL
jgi:hypothetical protein